MRYCLEININKDVLSVYVDLPVTGKKKVYDCPEARLHRQPKLVKDLFAIEGIIWIALCPCEIVVMKGRVFDWGKITSPVLQAIHMNLDPNGEMIKSHEDLKLVISKSGRCRRVPVKLSDINSKIAEQARTLEEGSQ